LFHGFDTLGSPLEGRRVPWLRRETCTLASHERTLIQLLTVNTNGFYWFIWRRYTYIHMVPSIPLYTRRAGKGTTSTSSVCMTHGPPPVCMMVCMTYGDPHVFAVRTTPTCAATQTYIGLYDVRRPACVLRYGHHTHVHCRTAHWLVGVTRGCMLAGRGFQ
jgi:hypothetical protein